MSEVLELECPLAGERLCASHAALSVIDDVRMSTHFWKIAEVTGRYFSEKSVRDGLALVCRPEKNQAAVSSWNGW